jgi:hypothetical protein
MTGMVAAHNAKAVPEHLSTLSCQRSKADLQQLNVDSESQKNQALRAESALSALPTVSTERTSPAASGEPVQLCVSVSIGIGVSRVATVGEFEVAMGGGVWMAARGLVDRGLLSLHNLQMLNELKLPGERAMKFILAVPGRRLGDFVELLALLQGKLKGAETEVIDELR